jgi:DNA-binding IclR family transcriptional regulator
MTLQQSSAGQGVERISAILRALADHAATGARLTDVATATGLSKSTAHRLIGMLSAEGLVEADAKSGLLYLGFEMSVLGAAAANRYGLVATGRETLEELERLTEDSIYLSVRSGFESVCIDRVVGTFPIKVLTLNVGDKRPLGIGAGSLALLAALDDAEVEQALRLNADKLAKYPNCSPTQLREMVARSRAEGYAFNDRRIIPGMYAVAVTVRDQMNRPLAALTVAAISERMRPERRAMIVSWVSDAASRLGERLGRVAVAAPKSAA